MRQVRVGFGAARSSGRGLGPKDLVRLSIGVEISVAEVYRNALSA